MRINLGTIESKVKVDGLAEFGEDLRKVDSTMQAFAEKTSRQFTRVEKDVKAVAQACGMSAQQMQATLDRALKQISATTAVQSLERLTKQMGLTRQEVQNFGQQMGLTEKTLDGLIAKLFAVKEASSGGLLGAKGFGNIITNTFAYGSAYQLLGWLQQMPGAIINANAKMETLQKSFQGIFGVVGGIEQFQYVSDVAQKYGKDIESVASSYRKYAAGAEYAGQSTTDIRKVFEGTVQALTKVGGTSEDVNGALIALGQMINKETVSSEEFRQQFAERIPGAMKMGANALGVTTTKFKEMMEKGEVVAKDFLPKLAVELQKFGVGWEASSDSIESNTARMTNALRGLVSSGVIQSTTNEFLKGATAAIKYADALFKGISTKADAKGLRDLGLLSDSDMDKMTQDELSKFVAGYREKTDAAKAEVLRAAQDSLENQLAEASANGGATGTIETYLLNNSRALKSLEKNLYIEKLKEQISAAQTLADKGINPEVNTKAVEYLAKILGDLTHTDWNVYVSANVDMSRLNLLISTVNQLTKGSAQQKIDTAQEQLKRLTDGSAVKELESMLGVAKAALSSENIDTDKAVAEVKRLESALKAIPNAAVEANHKISEGQKELAKYNYEQTDAYKSYQNKYGGDLVSIDKLPFYGAISQADAAQLKFQAHWQKLAAELQQGVVTNEGYWTGLQSISASYQGELDSIAKKQKAQDDALARHQNQVEKLGTTLENYLAKEMGLANNDTLGAKFAEIEEKANSLLGKVKDLALKGGISIEDATRKINEASEAAKRYAATSLVERLFPYLKKDNDIVAFWQAIYKQYNYLADAAKEAKMSQDEMWDAMVNKTAMADYQQSLQKLKSIMDNTFDFKEYTQNRDKLLNLQYKSGGTEEHSAWEDTLKEYDILTGRMLQLKSDMYDRIVAKAKEAGRDEEKVQAILVSKQEEQIRQQLELVSKYSTSLGQTFSAQWSLAFGSYKSDITKARDEWTEFSDSVIDLAKGMGDAVAGSWGDAIRNIASGKTDISSIGKNMVSRMIDSVAGFMEKSMKQSWNSMLRDLFGSDLSEAMGGTSSSALTSQTATLTASTASMDISTATINVASGSMNGGGGATGNATLNGSSGSDLLDSFGETAGSSFAKTLTQTTGGDGLIFSNVQGLESLIGSSSGADLSAINNLKGLHLEKLDPTFATQIGEAAKAFKEITGRNLTLTSGFRTYEQQAKLYAEKGPAWAAAPGKSMHELGQSADVASQDLEDFGKVARKFGLMSLKDAGLKNEPWHYQLDDSFGKQAAIRNGTFVSKWAGNASGGSFVSQFAQASTQDLKQLGSAIGSASGEKFYDTLQVEQQTSNSPQQDTLFSVQGTESLKSAEDALSSSGIKWNKIGGVLSGLSQVAVGAASGNVGSMIGGGISAIGGIGGMIGGTVGSMLGSYLPIVGTIVSVVSTLLSSSTKTEKTGSGYNVAINAGKVSLAGVDFYRTTTTSGYNTSTSHTASPGMTDPDVGREISVYLRDSAKNLKTFAKELGISTSALKDFSAPMVTITKDSISSYERNMSNLQAQFVLSAEGLRGAFDAVAEDYEIYVDEFKRLGEALKTVGGYTEAYGYDLYTMAGITDTAIQAIRDYNVESYQTAKDTYSQILPLIGATADQIQSVMDTLEGQAKEAAAVTDAQYAKILEADYASKLEEAVGGEDAFKQVMENLIKNILDSLESYTAQAEYYTKKANSAISDLNAPGVTIENFWDAFSQAMKSALSPDQFELWADASSWVNNLNTMNDAIEAWNENIKKVTATLQSREQSSTGNSRLAEITSLASTQEQELYEARKNNYDQATVDYIIEVQRLELAKKYADLDQDEYQKQQDLYARMATASDLSEQSTLISKYAAAEKELYEARSEGYSEATMALLEATQSAELAKTLSDNLKDVQNKIQSFQSKWADLTSREYAANKDDVMSGYTALQSQQAAELLQAYQDGMSQEYIDALKKTQIDELAKKWKDLNLSKLQDDLSDVKDDLDKIVNKFQEAMDSITTLIDAELSNVKSLAASADSANSSIASTLKDLTSGSDSPLNASQKAASLYYQIATAYGTMISTNASTASTSGGLDTTGLSGSQSASSLGGLFSTASSTMYSASGAAKTAAAQTISDLAGDYITALQSSLGDSAEFYDKYIDVLTVLKQAQSITGSEKSYETTIADALTAEQTILSDILKEIEKGSDASTTKIQALLDSSQAISSSMSGLYDDTVNNETSWRATVTSLLQQAGYSSDDITAALGGPTSTSSFLARLNEFNQTTMPTYIQSILDLLTQLINIQGQINTETPIATQPTTGSSYTQDEINWATNVRSAMNYENYGGSSSWTVDQVLKNLATYASWASAYGVSNTNAFVVPSGGSSNYYYQEASMYNKANNTTKTYLDMQNSVASGFGSNANYLAHWLGYGYNEGITFPTDDYVMSQTAKYYLAKWQRDGGAASGYSTPLAEATYIEQNMLGSATWTTSALEAAAKAHYDAYGKTEGLIKPYALGGLIDSPLALVGEVGPEIIASPGATVTPAAITQTLFGEAFSALSKEVRDLRTQLYAVMRSVAYNTQQTHKIIDKWDTEGTPAVAS